MGEDPARSRRARHLRVVRGPDPRSRPSRPVELHRGPSSRPVHLGAAHPLLRRPGAARPVVLARRFGRPCHPRCGPGGLHRFHRLCGDLARSLPRGARMLLALDDRRRRASRPRLVGDHGARGRAQRRGVPGLPPGAPSGPVDNPARFAHVLPAPSRSGRRHRQRQPGGRARPGGQGDGTDRCGRLPRLRQRARHRHPRRPERRGRHAGKGGPPRLLPRDDIRHLGR